ncbi:putative membrane protein [Pseudoxanthomonas sp. CF385]|uniref:PH domain-containing protein n=1 Tax=Pseudoxanthomonas sp. CF385 TaxID=1881042 RepID=UPI00088934A1|nr:PH domain-containing protein [Pseudoxanthomonas sp. CF385]SDQ31743.1 putative membrane protein [Pseudoxanthomonas sp. CF385]
MDDVAIDTAAPERRLHPWSWLFVLLQQLKQFIFPLVALLVFGARKGDDGDFWVALAPVIGIAVLVVLAILQYFTYRYVIGRDGLTVREGLLHRSRREIPFSRIHNVVVHQSLLHRVFGVAEVRLESAGGQKPEAQMRVLGLRDALALEDLVRHQARGSVPGQAASTDADTQAGDATLLSLSTAEVIRLGLISNRGMIVVAAGFGAAWQILPERMIEQFFRQGAKQAFGYAEQLHLGWMAGAASVVALVLLALAMVRALSVVLALLQFHGFRLSEDTRRLMVERGLLARLRTSVARRRIQAWTLHEGVLHRWFGRRSLRIDTAVAEKAGQQDQRALKDLAPIATPDACDALIGHLLPHAAWPRAEWQRAAASARWRLLLPTLVWLLPATALAAWHLGPWAWTALAWLPVAAYAAHRQSSRMGWSLDDHLVAVRSGWWSRYWRFAEIDKLQALRLSRSPLDHACGTASLWLDTAGASGIAAPLALRFVPEAEARATFERLSAALSRRRLRW